MGCDIHAHAEVRRNGQWEPVGAGFPLDEFGRKFEKRDYTEEPFGNRSYAVFGFLAGVRDSRHVAPLSAPKGLPPDISPRVKADAEKWDVDGHSHSWLSLRELLSADYAQPVTAYGCIQPLRDYVGEMFMAHLDVLKTLGDPDDVRVVFWFDN